MARRPHVVPPSPEPPSGFVGRIAQLVILPNPPDHRVLIDRVCAASHPVGVDRAQRRRWLEAQAEVYRSEAAKTVAITEACRPIGFRFE